MPGSSDALLNSSEIVVLDSWPVMEWLKGRDSAATVFVALIDHAKTGDVSLYLSTSNLGEIYYNTWIDWNEARAERTLERLRQLPIIAVLALELEAPVLTGYIDFLNLVHDGLLEVEWLGK